LLRRNTFGLQSEQQGIVFAAAIGPAETDIIRIMFRIGAMIGCKAKNARVLIVTPAHDVSATKNGDA
jgi:hypothetical protein